MNRIRVMCYSFPLAAAISAFFNPSDACRSHAPSQCCQVEPRHIEPAQFSAPSSITGRVRLSWVTNSECVQPETGFPSVAGLCGERNQVCYNVLTGLPVWTLEHVEKKTCQSFCVSGGETKLVDAIQRHTNFQFDPCYYSHSSPQLHRSLLQSNSLWDDFYHYVKFLTERYKNVYVCSGPLYSTMPLLDANCRIYNTSSILSHYFKVILAETEDGCYRLECYKFPNAPGKCDHHPELACFQVPRCDVETHAGLLVFQDVKSCMVSEMDTHPEFCPPRKCSRVC